MSARKPQGIIPRLLMALAVAFAPLGLSIAQAQALTAQNVAVLSKGAVRLNFIGALPSGVTYSRTGVATAYTVAGGVTSFAADAAQITDRGLLLEPQRENVQPYSADGTQWLASGVTRSESGVSYLPGGKRTLVTDPGAAGAFNRIVSNGADISVVSGTTYTFSLWYELGTSDSLRLMLDGGGTTGITRTSGSWVVSGTAMGTLTVQSDEVVDGAVRLAVLRLIATGSASGDMGFGPNATGSDQTVFFHGLQVEVGSSRTSPIITGAAAVTRGTPTVTVPVPAGRTRWRSVHYDGSIASGSGLTPGATFNIYSAITGAGKGGVGQELRRLEFLP